MICIDIQKLVKNLKIRGFKVSEFENREEASKYLCEQIQNTTVGIGGSLTVQEMGLYDVLSENNEVFWHWKDKDSSVRDMAAHASVYISSANAISETGEIVNIDGTGNRLAGIVYGNKKVYYIVGINKVCPDLESAIYRARNTAAVKNAERLDRKTPCRVDGKCHDCSCPDCICRSMLITMAPMCGMEAEIVVIKEELGY